jgi:ethanolamine ammonia-lyase large subunit
VGREAIYADLKLAAVDGVTFRHFRTAATDREEHLNDPELGSRLADDLRTHLSPEDTDVQIVVSDGLSAEAIHHNIPDLLPVLMDGLRSRDFKLGQPILVPFGRVKLAESIGDALHSKLTVVLIGERPGGDALASRSMSAYFAFRLDEPATRAEAARFSGNADVRYEYSVISNIYAGGLPPVEAGSVVAEKALRILSHQAAGNRLESLLSGRA